MDSVAPGKLASFERALKDAIGEPRFKMWITNHTKFSLEDQEFIVGVPNRFYREWLDAHYRGSLERCVEQCIGAGLTVRFRIDPELFRNHQAPANDAKGEPSANGEGNLAEASARPLRVGPSRYAYARFVVGSTNRMAATAAGTLIEDPRRAFSPLLFHGGHGLGKTHLLRGIEEECLRKHRHLRVLAISSEEFTNNYVEAVKTHKLTQFRKKVRQVDLLLVDDVQFFVGKTKTLEEFLHTLNSIESRGAKVVLTSDVHPRFIDRIPEELRSRLVAGMVIRIDPMDRAMRRQVILDKAMHRRMNLSEEIVDFLAENLRTSVCELEGALNYLEHFSETFGKRLTVDAVRVALAEILRHSIPTIRVQEVRERVCKLFAINSKSLSLRKRTKAVSHPRMLALFLARKYTASTYSEIGREIGGLNHSSVIAAERRIQDELNQDGEIVLGERTWKVRDAVEAFEREIGPS